MRVTQVFSNSRVFVFLNALKKVSASIANIIRITQITFEFMDKANLKMMNDSSKRHSQFLSLIFILNCLSKASVISIVVSKPKM